MNDAEYTKMYRLEDTYWWFVGRRYLALRLLKRYTRSGAPRVLDLGCGTGVVLSELKSWSEPTGLDMSTLALSYCQKRGLDRLVQGRGEALPFQDNCVDAIIGLDIFEHIEEDSRAFVESHRVLRPGGTVVLSVPAFMSLWGPHDVALMHFRRYRRNELKKRLESAGFEVEKLSYSVFFLFPIVVVWRFFEKRKKGPAKASLVSVPGFLNDALIGLQKLEALVLGGFNLPWGSSVIAVARKSGGSSLDETPL